MTNMFKKTLVATAVLAFAGAAQAATLNATVNNVAAEFLSVSDRVDAAQFTLTAGANYADNDLITITFSNKAVRATQLSSSVSFQGVNPARLDLLSSVVEGDKLVVTYRVTNASTGVGTAGQTTLGFFSNPQGAINSADFTSTVSATFSATTSAGVALDTTGGTARTATIARLVEQFATLEKDAHDLTAVIDVSKEREEFVPSVNSGPGVVAASFVSKSTKASGTPVNVDQAVSVTRTAFTLEGDFGWVFNTSNQPITNALLMACDNASVTPVITKTAAAVECTGANPRLTIIAQPGVVLANSSASVSVIPTNSYSLTAEYSFVNADASTRRSSKSLTVDAGRWTLNGSEVDVPYMPYGAGITQVINLNNNGTQTGNVTVEGYDRTGQAFGPVVVGVSAPGKQLPLAEAIKSAIRDAGINVDTTGERVSLKIVTNVPAKDVTVYSAYNTGNNGARLVVNSSNGAN